MKIKSAIPSDLLQVAQALDSTFYQIGKGDLEGTLVGEMISLWREASGPFFEELFESVLCLELSTIHPDKAPFLIGKHASALSYGLAAAIEAEAEKVVLASFRRGFGKAGRDVEATITLDVPAHRAYPYAGFVKAALGSFFGMKVVPAINYILKEFSLFQSGENLDTLCTILRADYIDPVLHWRKEASIHVKRSYHYGYVCGMRAAGTPLLVVSPDKECCSTCREMSGVEVPTEFAFMQYRKIALSSYETLLQIAPFPTPEAISEWAGDLAFAPFASLPLHPFCKCVYGILP